MKHAGSAALDGIEDLLDTLRQMGRMTERRRGIFYWRSAACLHFHEDSTEIFADLKCDGEWIRLPVATASDRRALVAKVRSTLESP